MKRNTKGIIGILGMAMLVYTCKTVQKTAQLQRDAAGKIIVNPNPSTAYLSPAESMKTIHLQKGYHLQLVAAEPMIKEPVAIAWDGNARMYVAELLTYMQDADAKGEQQPFSRISLLEDTNNDGKMDKSTVFIDHLLLPRMMQCVGNALLVNETNTITITSYRDTNGDGVADEKKVLYKDDKYKPADMNMEHQRSGLDWNLDNWMYVTYDPVRFRYTNGTMKIDTMASGTSGQWGVTHDNYGRLYFTSAGGENPVRGVQINPSYGRLDFADQISSEFQEVWPIIETPDVQGGEKRLRPNVTLNHFTACAGQSIYRGDQLPKDLVGDYLIPEPVGRIIRRAKVINVKGKTIFENAYNKEEFISSSDMNFRPVNSATGPDGNLYIVDMHRGIIQQGTWTPPGSYLRKKIDSIGLAQHTGHGRIYRVVYDGYKKSAKPNMLNETTSQLVAHLDHPNGWWRDNAQKEIITRADKSVVPALKAIVNGTTKMGNLAKIHALWTLEGLESLDKDVIFTALKDQDPQVRRTAVWVSEGFLKKNDAQVIDKVSELKDDASYDVRVQVLMSLNLSKADKSKAVVSEIVAKNTDNEMITATKAALERNENVRTYGARLSAFSAVDRNWILMGAATFKSLCATCHGADGKGLAVAGDAMPAPPLFGSKRLAFADKVTPVKIVMHGLMGPVDGKTYPSVMPAMQANSDEWISSVVTYIRYEFGEAPARRGMSPVVKPDEVEKIRAQIGNRTASYTLSELGK
jgi:glucose/arabinose dehydrogenase/mono/diheme cytochrome c family protein